MKDITHFDNVFFFLEGHVEQEFKSISEKFPTLSDTEEALDIEYIEEQSKPLLTPQEKKPCQQYYGSNLSPIFCQSPGVLENPSVGESLNVFVAHFKLSRCKGMKEQFLNYLLKLW